MTFTRRIQKGENTYVYNVRTYREKGTGKVKQETEYLGKEVFKDGEPVIIPPKRGLKGIRATLEYGGCMALFRTAEGFGLAELIDGCVAEHTRIEDPGTKLVILALCKVLHEGGLHGAANWYARTTLSERLDIDAGDLTPKRVRDLLAVVARERPDVIGRVEEAIVQRIKDRYGENLDTVVYDLTPIAYYGDANGLARYGSAYRKTGEKQVNLALAVTMRHRLPVHHKVLAGTIVSVSAIHAFLRELEAFDVKRLLLVLDRGFYSRRNVEDIVDSGHDVISALPARLKLAQRALAGTARIEDSRNRLHYAREVLFSKESKDEGLRLIVYHSPERRSRELTRFYDELREVEDSLAELKSERFPAKVVLEEELEGVCDEYGRFIDLTLRRSDDGWTFDPEIRHKAVQRWTNRFGKTVLFTSTDLSREDVLRVYREKDVIEKTFCLMKGSGLEPLRTSREESTRATVFLSYLGYLLLSLMRMKLEEDASLEAALDTLGEIREVAFKDGSRALPELTKEQKELLVRLGAV